MAILVAGPSSVGKSTFIASVSARRRFDFDLPNIVYGFQVGPEGFPPDSIIHYNLLRQARALHGSRAALRRKRSLLNEPAFARIVSSGLIERCIVLVAPEDELMERIGNRLIIEPFQNERYPRDIWRDVTNRVDLFGIYDTFCSTLEGLGIPYQVIASSVRLSGGFALSDRQSLRDSLAGRFQGVSEPEELTA